MTAKIKPGTELDQAVAKAIGWEYAGYCRRGPMFAKNSEDGLKDHVEVGIDWTPSTNLNHAFKAAEKIGLFDYSMPHGYRRCLFRINLETWRIGGPDFKTDAQTPALAVCAAILKLKG